MKLLPNLLLCSLLLCNITESPKVAPPMPPTEGRYEVVIDNDVIKRLDLTPFHNSTGIVSADSGKHSMKQIA